MVGGMKAQTLQVVGAGPGAAEGPLAAADSLSQAAKTAADPAGLEVQQADAAEVGAVSGPSRPSGSGPQAEAVVSGELSEVVIPHVLTHSPPLSSTDEDSPSSSGEGPRKLIKLLNTHFGRSRSQGRRRGGAGKSVAPQAPMVLCENTALLAGLRPSIKDRIRKGWFVNMFEITKAAKKGLDAACERGGIGEEAYKTFSNWVTGYCAFAACYIETRPEAHEDVWKYMHLINEMFVNDRPGTWLKYDELFRERVDGRVNMPLGVKDVEIWMQLNRASLAFGPGAQGNRFPQGGRRSAPQFVKNRCFAFNNTSCGRGETCRYRHSCTYCRGPHSAKECPRSAPGLGRGRGSDGNMG
ncbi:uncharacterized protein LOC142143378 [Mixophyes fleayi]|uniref:uncharacterized protein LOC142143378 n=1 Tax=Mixophyes fleayi TaxID=3061075 RepID=UPI003F4E3BE7